VSEFADPEAAARTVERISATVLRSSGEFVVPAAESSSRPDQALNNLERWLGATSNPTTYFDSMVTTPEFGRLLIALFGASHQIADVLVQNPELAASILDPSVLYERPDPVALSRNVESLLAESTSYSHSLDRLRFVKQSWHVRIAAADLAGAWPEEAVWRALSDVADVLVAKVAEIVWLDVCRQRSYLGTCPISIVAMGKLGGQELNFSSDIDLVYALADGSDEELEKLATRYCEALNRALADRMGRGSLYRVDLRLRPYGSRGPLAPQLGSIEGYYARYAEPWEHLALIRSRVIVGSEDTRARWSAARSSTCFKPQRGEWVVQDLLKIRARMEESSTELDLKRGPGGIRDVEFLTQILQLLFVRTHPSADELSTCAALRALAAEGVLEAQAADELIAAYTFLRQVEHRIQLLGDQQTHTLPSEFDARSELARRTGYATLEAFDASLAMHRANAKDWYQKILKTAQGSEYTAREAVLATASHAAQQLSRWIDALPSSSSFYESLSENESSLGRALVVVERAPALVPMLQEYVAVTEQVMTGEILEQGKHRLTTELRALDLGTFARLIRTAWLRAAVRHALGSALDFGAEVSAVYDSALLAIVERCRAPFQVIALGSYGARDMALYSDLDVIFYGPEKGDHVATEKAAQDVLSTVQSLHRAGAPIDLDIRLRPEGKKGRLVVNDELLRSYDERSMEPWERLALGRARCIQDGTMVPKALKDAAFGRPLDTMVLSSLTKMKRRVETERVPVQHRDRHIKLGPGGQDDVLWLVQLLWWKNSGRLPSQVTSVPDRLRALAGIGQISAVTVGELVDAWALLRATRLSLALLGYNDEVLPENPDRLARLGAVSGLGSANEVLSLFEYQKKLVRGHFEAVVESLKG
jgi:glutamate-ammonia-ligase adenylyltransferase